MKRIAVLFVILAAASLTLYAQSAHWQLVRAEYGAGHTWVDVTSRVAALISGQQLRLTVSNSTLGGDPAEHQPKQLRVIYLWQGIRYEAITPEGAALSIP